MDFFQKLKNYADLIVSHGVNVQPGQLVNVGTEAYHRELAFLVVEAAYNRGAKYVGLDLIEPRANKSRLQNSTLEQLEYIPKFVTVKYDELVESQAANVRIVGAENPEVISDEDPKKINTARLAQYNAVKRFYEEGLEKSKIHWTVVAAATKGWAIKVFPDAESSEEAEKLLWEEIFKICRVDREDYLEAWKEHNTKLQTRADALTKMKIKKLHFSGPGTDFYVGLSDKAKFKGGQDKGPYGAWYEPNLPTEECFTTPDWRETTGKVKTTRPFFVNGKLIRGLEMTFVDGLLTDYNAEEGQETFKEYVESDAGAKRLGEVALVGVDSPIFSKRTCVSRDAF